MTYPNAKDFPVPDDFVPDEDFEDEHQDSKGPGGIVNYPVETHPEGWVYVEGESSPKVDLA